MNDNQPTTTTGRRRRPNYLYTNISVTLVLFVLGLFGLWMLQAAHLGKAMKEKVDLFVELREGTDEVARLNFEKDLKEKTYVLSETVNFRDKDLALEEMGEEINQDLQELNLPNPFRDMISFNVKSNYLQVDSLENIVFSLREMPVVLDVFYQDNFIDEMIDKAQRLGWILLGVAILLVVIAIVLIHNMVRLSLFANRFLIKSQQLVGASWGFISRPYLRRAALYGFMCGLMAAAMLFGLQYWLNQLLPELELFARLQWLAYLYGGLLLLGVFISWLSHYFTVRRYLKMRTDDLY